MARRAFLDSHASPRRAAGDLPLVDVAEKMLRRRKKKDGVFAVAHSTVEYRNAEQRQKDLNDHQPNPADVTIRKRSWEIAIRTRRHYVRSIAVEGAKS